MHKPYSKHFDTFFVELVSTRHPFTVRYCLLCSYLSILGCCCRCRCCFGCVCRGGITLASWQVLLSKHSALLKAAEDSGRNDKVLSTRSVLRGSLAWLVMGACAVYALVSVVEEELAYQFGTARVTLVITQVHCINTIAELLGWGIG